MCKAFGFNPGTAEATAEAMYTHPATLRSCLKIISLELGEGSVGKVVVLQAWGPEFGSPASACLG